MMRDYAAIQAALRAYYLDFDVDPTVLDAALDRRPELETQALFFDWGDTEMRQSLLDEIGAVIGVTWPNYGDFKASDRASHEFRLAHDTYMRED